MKNHIIRTILLLSLAVFLFGTGFKIGQLNQSFLNTSAQTNKKAAKNTDFSLFWDVWSRLEEKFIDKKKVDSQKMYYGAIKGMVSSLEDSYTFFLTPEENKESKDDLGGKFEGIGAQLGLQDNRIIVVAPLKNSPAVRAGVLAGDFINKVNGQSTKNWTLPQAVSKIRGQKGTKVTLTLERDGKEKDIAIVRDQIQVDSVELSYEKKGAQTVAVIKVNQFGDNTNEEWDRAVSEVAQKWQSKEIKGLVLDVRDNPGGYLDGSVYLASEFLPLDRLVVKQESTVENTKTYTVERQGLLLDIPLVTLINKGSASASEILAGSLRDHKRTTLVGEKSFGKGSVQEALDLKGGAGLHVTVAKWILPNGDWINEKGIEPATVIENDIKDGNTLNRKNDLQLDKAIEQLTLIKP